MKIKTYIQRFFLQGLLLFSIGNHGFAQTERVHLDLDKYRCNAGDTIYFKGYVSKVFGISSLSTNLYVEVYNEVGGIISKDIFPVVNGLSTGQVTLQDSLPSANYFILAFTKLMSGNKADQLFSVPVQVWNKQKPNADIRYKKNVSTTAADFRKGGITWTSFLKNGKIYSELLGDSLDGFKKMQIVLLERGDCSIVADILLSRDAPHQFTLFPIPAHSSIARLLLFEDTVLIARHIIQTRINDIPVRLETDTLDRSPNGYNSWHLLLPDSAVYFTSISITDADRTTTCPLPINQLYNPYSEELESFTVISADSSYISLPGYAVRKNGKEIKGRFIKELAIAGAKEGKILFSRNLSLDDEGRFRIDSLFFFGEMDLLFRINQNADVSTDEVSLRFENFQPSFKVADIIATNWKDGATRNQDTSFKTNQTDTAHPSIRILEEVVVTASIGIQRSKLDEKFTTGVFSEPSLLSFDLRNETRYASLEEFLRNNIPGISFDPPNYRPKFHSRSVIFYLDETLVTWDFLTSASVFASFAYAKAFMNQSWISETPGLTWMMAASDQMIEGPPPERNFNGLATMDFKDPLVVCIYRRKEPDDFRMLSGGMNKITVQGYTPILPFTPDQTTLYWNPWLAGNEFHIRFTNNKTTNRFRVKLMGINSVGRTVQFETIVQ